MALPPEDVFHPRAQPALLSVERFLILAQGLAGCRFLVEVLRTLGGLRPLGVLRTLGGPADAGKASDQEWAYGWPRASMREGRGNH